MYNNKRKTTVEILIDDEFYCQRKSFLHSLLYCLKIMGKFEKFPSKMC